MPERANRLMCLSLLLLMGLAMGGCGEEPRIDGSDTETADASIEHISSLLPADEVDTFHNAIDVLAMHEMTQVIEAEPEASQQQQTAMMEERLRQRLHDQTAGEVVAQVLSLAEENEDASADE